MLRQALTRLFRHRSFAESPVVKRAFVDELTGLPTRYVMTDHLRAMQEQGVHGVIAVVDVDHFKQFNDRYGHTVGDGILQLVARRLRDVLPEDALLARLGGDEFFAFMPNAALAQAEALMHRCCERGREPLGLEAAPDGRVTLSCGLATFHGQGIDEIMRAADLACYAAKARGRDRVVVFDEDTRKVVQARRELLATVVSLQQKNRELESKAYTDALTGLRNRLSLDEVLDVTLGAPSSPWSKAAVAFIDIDHFGDYNHLVSDAKGDEALQRVAACVKSTARAEDLVFRKGGEEFVLLLPELRPSEALIATERVRQHVMDLVIPHPGSPVAPVLTVTIGLATGGAGRSVRSLMNAAADQAMAAKVDGRRNRVHLIEH